jgi:ATP-dependent RNA helicase DeaD
MPANAFDALGLDRRLTAVLAELGYEEPTPVQKRAIPPLVQGRDLVAQAATGTGKTAAFALALLQRLFVVEGEKRGGPSVLVLVPTRELAMQVAEAMHRYGRQVRLRVLPIYGGQPINLQLRALARGVDVVVATPGRARDHIRRGTLVLTGIRALVLDEADEMLDMGFAEDLEAILQALPQDRQTALFSATIPPRIAALAKRYLRDAVRLEVAEEPARKGSTPRIRERAYLVTRAQKVDGLSRVLDIENPTSALVFCRTRTEVEELALSLAGRGRRAEALHGGYSQVQRDRVMRRFREGTADVLLATDVAARGLDVRHLTHVVNFDLPSAPESYVHRIGRTGRAGDEGTAITLVEPRERPLLRNIERFTGRRIELASLPTAADLRTRRLELTRASLREALLRGAADEARVVVENLAAEFDIMDIAAAAVHLLHQTSERDSAAAVLLEAPAEPDLPEPPRPGKKQPARGHREAKVRRKPPGEPPQPVVRGGSARARAPEASTRVYVSVGRSAGVGTADLLGVLTREASLPRQAIGPIELGDRFSLIDVPEPAADTVVEAFRRATLGGRRLTASRYRPPRERRKPAGKPR